ncbi:cation:proton antiporter [Candidatus Peregrinibacteria bacterium]|jgi:Kef-type K+ transport system membrane component KefB|nr:cation:proton antiporter [Candidatus Peregrinibacteria bacterium]MBT4631806.1 cation:proton antiporter [Candidatus Peregrinibacteria bacterium]MBT5517308.1 cation:proton antiporter [Candidatus Peregrinibacteria bacterium]MBT5824469.1 cation:proton antiporter [Candidatus Peregrinibacteria bacterium]
MFLGDLLILLVFVWLSRKLFQFLHLPALFGEVFAGVIAGPIIFGLVQETEAITVLAELGIFLLMFHSGLEADPKDLFHSSKKALLAAFGGMALTVLGIYFVTRYFGYDIETALFMAMTLSITAVAISTRIFKDLKINHTKVAHTVIAAAVMIEILMLIIFSVFINLHETGAFDLKEVAISLGKFIGYFAAVFIIGHHYFKYLYKILYKGNKGFMFSIILALAFAVSAELIGLHFIIGAFLAGLFLHSEIFDDEVFNKIEDRTFGLSYSFLAPIFFATLAFHLDFTALFTMPAFIAVIIITAILGKVLGSGLMVYWGGMSKNESIGVGLAMNSRGAVDLIVASIGLQAGIINVEIFSVLVLASFASTFISIVAMRPIAKKLKALQVK